MGKIAKQNHQFLIFIFPKKKKITVNLLTDYKIFQNDYAIGILDKPLSTAVRYYGLSIIPKEKLKKIIINVTGYPAEKSEKGANAYQLWGIKGNIIKKELFY